VCGAGSEEVGSMVMGITVCCWTGPVVHAIQTFFFSVFAALYCGDCQELAFVNDNFTVLLWMSVL